MDYVVNQDTATDLLAYKKKDPLPKIEDLRTVGGEAEVCGPENVLQKEKIRLL
jgi:hypothetical protein